MAYILLAAALFIGTSSDQSIFDEPYQWPRIAFCAGFVVLATVVFLVRGDE